MEENNQATVAKEEKTKTPASAKFKEWCRKQIVNLKRKPHNIPLVLFLITSLIYFIWLYTFSYAISPWADNADADWVGLCVFINILLSLLILVCHLYAFPKRKKPNIFFIILVVVMAVAMIVSDICYYNIMSNFIDVMEAKGSTLDSSVYTTISLTIAHIVLLGICLVVFALLPVYSKLINKIDTSIKVESATENLSSGAIDLQED